MKLYVVVKKCSNSDYNYCCLVAENSNNRDIILSYSRDVIMRLLDLTYNQYYELLKNECRKEIY